MERKRKSFNRPNFSQSTQKIPSPKRHNAFRSRVSYHPAHSNEASFRNGVVCKLHQGNAYSWAGMSAENETIERVLRARRLNLFLCRYPWWFRETTNYQETLDKGISFLLNLRRKDVWIRTFPTNEIQKKNTHTAFSILRKCLRQYSKVDLIFREIF